LSGPSLVWFRQDLRLEDQPAVAAATAGGSWIGVYVLDDDAPGGWALGSAQRWWLHYSLKALAEALEDRGGCLILRRGDSAAHIVDVARAVSTDNVHALRHYEPWWQAAEQAVADRLDLRLYDGRQLAAPGSVRTAAGGRYRMFTPFSRALNQQMPPGAALAAPRSISVPSVRPASEQLEKWGLLPHAPNWAGGFDVWRPGETGAHEALENFMDVLKDYAFARDRPALEGTSRLSAHLHFGEISAAALWRRASKRKGAEPWLRQLAWRDFCANIIDIMPDYANANGRPLYDKLAWRKGASADRDFHAWTRGLTGYPIVDAGMRQLWATGFMHNRVRMIAASFLIKHLLIDWRRGERWFWDTLIDADYGNNSVNWQWVAGTGIDSNPFGRIMAPLVQSAKFDSANYIRRWVRELAEVDDAKIHDPHATGAATRGYPPPIIGHRAARERALAAQR